MLIQTMQIQSSDTRSKLPAEEVAGVVGDLIPQTVDVEKMANRYMRDASTDESSSHAESLEALRRKTHAPAYHNSWATNGLVNARAISYLLTQPAPVHTDSTATAVRDAYAKTKTLAPLLLATPVPVSQYWLDAIVEIEDLDDYAAETEMEPLSPVAKKLARRLFDEFFLAVPRRYAFSPWEKGAVIVQANGAKYHSVSVYCRANGGASLYVFRPQGCVQESHYHLPEAIRTDEIIKALKGLDA